MIIDLNKVYVSDIKINNEIVYEDDYYSKSAIKGLDPVIINGKIVVNNLEEMNILLKIDGNMYLEDAVSLKLVKYPFNVLIEEVIDFDDEYFCIENNKMDLKEFVWKNIVLEIPIRVVDKKDEEQTMEGEGWSLNSKEADNNNAFSQLKDLYKE